MKTSAVASLLLALVTADATADDFDGCSEETFEIREKAEDGSTLRLEFGSLWAIEPAEWAHTRVWLRLERVHICADGLRKEDTPNIVTAIRVE